MIHLFLFTFLRWQLENFKLLVLYFCQMGAALSLSTIHHCLFFLILSVTSKVIDIP